MEEQKFPERFVEEVRVRERFRVQLVQAADLLEVVMRNRVHGHYLDMPTLQAARAHLEKVFWALEQEARQAEESLRRLERLAGMSAEGWDGGWDGARAREADETEA